MLVQKDSILSVMYQTVSENGDDTFVTWYDSNGKSSSEYTFRGLWEEAGIIAHYLHNVWHLKKGTRVVLCYNLGLHFFAAFLGCLRAGVVAVLVYTPVDPLHMSLPKMNRVLSDYDAKLILTDADIQMNRRADL